MPYLVAFLCGLSILLGQYLYGGIFRSAFVFPSYLILIVAALISAIYLFLRKQDVPKISCLGLTGVLVLWVALRSCLEGGLPQASEFLQLALGCFLIYLMLAYMVVKAEPRIVFLLIILGGALVQAGVAGGQFFGVWGGQPQGWISEQLRVWYDRGDAPNVYRRAHGFYINGNHLVWLLNAAGFFSLAMGAFGRGKAVAKVLWVYVGGTCLAISLACLSRGGLLALGGGMVFIFILSSVAIAFAPGRRIASFSALIGAFAIPTAVVLFILNQNASIQARASLLFEEGYRPQVWMTALREFQIFPWLGAGSGAFTYYSRQFRIGSSSTDDYFAHNDWLQLAADYGFPALLLAILVIVVHLACGCRGYVRILRGRVTSLIPQSNSAALLIGAATVVVAFSIHSLFDFNLQLPANAFLAAACLGMLANSGQGGGRTSGDVERSRPILRIAGSVLLIGAAVWLLTSVWVNRAEFQRLKAENYMLTGEYDLASQIAEEAALHSEDSPALNYIMGVSRQRLAQAQKDPKISIEQLNLAIGDLQKAIRFAPSDRSANIELARSLLISGRLEEAKKAAFEVIRLEPRQVIGYELYGSILEAQGDIYSARRVYLLGSTLWNTDFLRERLEVLGKNVENLP